MYIDAYHNKESDEILVAERKRGKRYFKRYPAKYSFYVTDKKGKYRSIFGDKVSKVETNKYSEFKKELKINENKKIFESDINPINKILEENYLDSEVPNLHICFFDIEVDFDPEKGFANPEDPHSKITAITLHLNWLDSLITIAIPPDTISFEEAKNVEKRFDNTFILESEEELLRTFFDLIQDSDIISGYNSEGFDIPYVVERTKTVLSKEYNRKLCFWHQEPRKRTFVKFNKEHTTYDLVGRVHLDYLDLYKKHATQQLHSYKLDYVAEVEVGAKKTPYEGTLDELYRYDFDKFIEYNRQDVDLLAQMENKLKYIELANQLAHTNTVRIPQTMGSVALIEQAVINEAHRRGFVVPDKETTNTDNEPMSAAGAYVVDPNVGLHHYIGSVDISSLYPSVIRSLNMGPETLIGQLRPTYTERYLQEKLDEGYTNTDAWHDMFGTFEYEYVLNKEDEEIILDTVDGHSETYKASEIYDFIFHEDSPYAISANGTVFMKNFEGIIPGLLGNWYNERKKMKKKKGNYEKIASGIEINEGLAEKVKEYLE